MPKETSGQQSLDRWLHNSTANDSAMDKSDALNNSDDYKLDKDDSDFEIEESPKKTTGASKGAKQSSKPTTPKTAKPKKTVESEYKKMSQLEHILARPDTYIGSIEPTRQETWVYDAASEKMVHRKISFVPGLYKIFDEILVNAADNKQRDPGMTKIDITINPETNEISILNDGKGIPVVIRKEHNIYVPTLIFGHLLTSSNYNDEERKVTGGRNGYGAKLCNAYSSKFTVETASSEYKKKFKQSWTSNMHKAGEPKIDELKSGVKDYTKITFQPDLPRFKMDRLDEDTVALLTRRAYDVAGTAWGVKVTLNGTRLPVKDFKDYVALYTKGQVDEAGQPLQVVYEKVSPRWEIALTSSDSGALQQVSFVNSIATMKGGKHVDHVVDPLADKLKEAINKKNKNKLDVKPNMVKSHLWVFINCLIENPAFDSQTKENMTLPIKSFGSKCVLSEKFIGKALKMGIVENIMAFMQAKAQTQLSKKLTGGKTNKLRGIAKLEDANDAGTKHSRDCTLILTEGDSAKALVVSGFSVVGRDKFGVFPLRGKLLNVRDASHKQIMENTEINHIIKILGLQYKKKYESADELNSLRYGRVMIMTDQDPDGSHIKGLLINFIHNNWPGLIKARFVDQFITPIVKVSRGNSENTTSFYSLPEFEQWKQDTPDWAKWKVKYYKGLGTSTAKEAKEYFADTKRHRIQFRYGGNEDDENIQMAFSKNKVEERKHWLTTGMQERKDRRAAGLGELYLYQHDTATVTYTDFVNKELILFSNIDNERSIPSLMDGLKPGQRKVLFTCLKRNDKREVKVAQLAGSVAELSAYHHGEQSLMSTIVNLAQDFVGANNINILMPYGQFGTRLQGGNDSASPRYIFTMLSPLARLMFPAADEPLLHSLTDDNQRIEPEWYCPILPLVLVNGAEGIGTGWSTKVPNYNPREIVDNLRVLMQKGEGAELKRLVPWYRGFRGSIQPVDDDRFLCDGEVGLLDSNWIEITELPVGVWTQNYKEKTLEPYLTGAVGEKTQTQPKISDYKEYHTDTTVRFTIKLSDEQFRKANEAGFHNYFKLRSFINTTSMVLFDAEGCLQKYKSAEDILREFFRIRLRKYDERKVYLENMLQAEADKLSNQARFILEKISGDLKLENVKKTVMHEMLKKRGYDSDPVKEWKKRMEKEQRALRKRDLQEEIAEANEMSMLEEQEAAVGGETGGETDFGTSADEAAMPSKSRKPDGPDYDYLGQMAIYSLTLERKEEIIKQRDAKQAELVVLQRKTGRDLWNEDLDKFLEELKKQELRDIEAEQTGAGLTTTAGGGSKKGGGKKRAGPVAKTETRPSANAERVVPEIDASIKLKVEASKKTKTARAAGNSAGTKVKKMKFDPDADENGGEDERALVEFGVENGDSSHAAAADDDDEKKPIVKATKKPAVSSSNGIVDASSKSRGVGGGAKRTASTKSSKTTKEPKETKGKKAGGGRKRKSWGSDDEDDASDDDKSSESDGGFSLNDDDSDVGGKKKKTAVAAAAGGIAVKKAIDSDDDDDIEEVMPKPKNRATTARTAAAASSKADSKTNKVDSDDDDDDIVKAVAKKAEPVAAKPAAAKPAKKKAVDSDDDVDFDDFDDKPQKPKAAVAKPTARPTTKKTVDSDDDDSDVGGKAKKAKTAVTKPAATKPPKKKAVDSDDDDFEIEEVQPKPKNRAGTIKPVVNGKSSSAAPSKSKNAAFDDDDESGAVGKNKSKKPSKFADSDDEPEVMPQPKKRAAAVAAMPKVMELDSESDSEVDSKSLKKKSVAGKKPATARVVGSDEDDYAPQPKKVANGKLAAAPSSSTNGSKKPVADDLDDEWNSVLNAVGYPSPEK